MHSLPLTHFCSLLPPFSLSLSPSLSVFMCFMNSSDEEASYSAFYPIIPGDVMSVKEILTTPKFPRHRTWYSETPLPSSHALSHTKWAHHHQANG